MSRAAGIDLAARGGREGRGYGNLDTGSALWPTRSRQERWFYLSGGAVACARYRRQYCDLQPDRSSGTALVADQESPAVVPAETGFSHLRVRETGRPNAFILGNLCRGRRPDDRQRRWQLPTSHRKVRVRVLSLRDGH